MSKPQWFTLFAGTEPEATADLLQNPAHIAVLCRLLENYMADHRVPLSPDPFRGKSSFVEVEFTAAIDLHWFLERLQTRAAKGMTNIEHRAKLIELFEAFQCEGFHYLQPLQNPIKRRREGHLAAASKKPRIRKLSKDLQIEHDEVALKSGKRFAAGILAKKHGVTPAAIRKALAKKKNET